MHPLDRRDPAIELGFRDFFDEVELCSHGRWRLSSVMTGTPITLHAAIVDDDWLVAGVIHGWSARSWWPVLQLNAGLDGCVRLTSAQGGGLELRGEIFAPAFAAEEQPSLRERVVALCRDVVSAGRQIAGARASAVASPSSDPEALLRICNEAGWQGRGMDGGDVRVTLDTRSADCQATLSLGAERRLLALAPLTTSATLLPESHEAIARVLLEATTRLRLVKGVAIRQDGGEIAALSFAGERQPATAATVDSALAALSVACRVVELEVRALQHRELASEYVLIRGLHLAEVDAPASCEQEEMPCLQLP